MFADIICGKKKLILWKKDRLKFRVSEDQPNVSSVLESVREKWGNVEIVTNNGLPVVDEPATGGKSVYVLRIVWNMSKQSICVRNSVVALSKPSSLLN